MDRHEKAKRAENYLQDEFFIGELDNLRNIQYDIIGNSGRKIRSRYYS
jgi:hypothetical protein